MDFVSGSEVKKYHPSKLRDTAVIFTGELVYASEFLRSASYDAHSVIDTRHMHPQFRWERNLGDVILLVFPASLLRSKKSGGALLTQKKKTGTKPCSLRGAALSTSTT